MTPTGVREVKEAKGAQRRRPTLQGLHVGLLDNNKPNADRFLAHVGALLQERYDGVELVSRRKTSRTAAECLAELAERCDVVINAFAD